MIKFTRKNNSIIAASLVFLSLYLTTSEVLAQPTFETWNLPCILNDTNTKITFKLDSTWHTVHGLTSGLRGNASLSDPQNPHSVNVNLEIPVSNLNTDNESRDEELRNVMNERDFPNVIFSARGLKGLCTPQLTKSLGACEDQLISELKIRDVKKTLAVPVTITSEGEQFKVSGKLPIKWAEYNVEDPSIFLIASVDEIVEIEFNIIVKK